MSYLEHLSNGTASTIEQQRAATVIKTLKILQSMSPSEICGKFHLQNCHCCERMWCNDNTNSVKDELIKRNQEIYRLNCIVTVLLGDVKQLNKKREKVKLHANGLLNEQDKRIKELYRQRNLLYKYAEIHGEKFFLYAPLEKEYRDLLNEIEAEEDALY